MKIILFCESSRGIRAPQATELYDYRSQTVADLDPVELDSYELALQGGGNNWNYSAAVYWMDKENEILQNSDRMNLNGVRPNPGFELAVGYDLTDSLSVNGVFNYADHTYDNDSCLVAKISMATILIPHQINLATSD